MQKASLATRMKRGEYFQDTSVPPGMLVIIRVDGKSFSQLSRRAFEPPFDPRFEDGIKAATMALCHELHGVAAYAQSDEASILLNPVEDLPWSGRIEKLCSIAASLASVEFTLATGQRGLFDARVWVGASDEDASSYMAWRMRDAERNSLRSFAYWTLRREGMSEGAATKTLHGMRKEGVHELLHARGLNWAKLPEHRRRGIGMLRRLIEHKGYDPSKQLEVISMRRKLELLETIPEISDWNDGVRQALNDARRAKDED